MKLSLSTGSLYVYPLQWVFEAAAAAGFSAVEVVVSLETILRGPQSIRRLAESRDLKILTIHPPLLPLPGWDDIEHSARLVDFARDVGATVLVQHTPNTSSLDTPAGQAWLRALEGARRRADEQGVAIALENRAIFRDHQRQYALADPEALWRFAEAQDFPVTLDTAHAATWPYDVLDLYALFSDRLANLHLSDFRPLPAWLDSWRLHTYIKHHQLPGGGVLPIRDLLARLQADGYTGPITFELSPIALRAWWPAAARANLARSIAAVRDGNVPQVR